VDFIKKYAYVILGVLCVLALGGLFVANNSRSSGVMSLGQDIGVPRHSTSPVPAPQSQEAQAELETTSALPPSQEEDSGTIFVHIIGAVYAPGPFEVPYGSRVFHVLELAGGATYEADLELINLVAAVHDGMQIRIPFEGEEPQPQDSQPGQDSTSQGLTGQSQAAITADGLVNINLANLTELQTLPGIGAAIAQHIIDHREAMGGFNSIEELLNVPQIGATRFENMRNFVTVGG